MWAKDLNRIINILLGVKHTEINSKPFPNIIHFNTLELLPSVFWLLEYYIIVILVFLEYLRQDAKVCYSIHSSFLIYKFLTILPKHRIFVLEYTFAGFHEQRTFRYPDVPCCPFQMVVELLPVAKLLCTTNYTKWLSKCCLILYFKHESIIFVLGNGYIWSCWIITIRAKWLGIDLFTLPHWRSWWWCHNWEWILFVSRSIFILFIKHCLAIAIVGNCIPGRDSCLQRWNLRNLSLYLLNYRIKLLFVIAWSTAMLLLSCYNLYGCNWQWLSSCSVHGVVWLHLLFLIVQRRQETRSWLLLLRRVL